MKKLLFLFVLLVNVSNVNGQTYDWSSDMPADPYLSSGQVKSIMHQGKLYHFSDSIGSYIRVTMYNPEVGNWIWLDAEGTYISSISRIEGEVINNKAYLVTGGSGGLYTHMFDFTTNTIIGYNSLIATGGLGNWEFKADPTSGTLVVMFKENTNINICTFNTSTNVWDTEFGVNSLLDPGFSGSGNYLIYFSSTSIFYGVSGAGNNRLAVAPINTPYALVNYNSSGSNDGRLKNDLGNNFVSGNFFMVGNGQNAPTIYMRNYTDQKTYEKNFTGTNIQLNSVTDPSLNFNIDTVRFATTQNASYSFLLSNFSAAGDGSTGNSYVFRKDWGTGIWDTLGIQIPLTAGLNNLFMISLDQSGEHVAINYQNDGNYYYKVFNTKPELNPGSIISTNGTCANHENLLYHALEFYDDNKDGPLKILNLNDLSGNITGMSAELIYFDNTSSPSVTKYAIYGYVGAGGNSTVQFQLFDGYSITNVTLPVSNVGSTPTPVVSFSSNPLTLCSNDNLIDLTNYVNYYDHGSFEINGNPVAGTTIDGTVLSQTFTGGTIILNDEIDGCMIIASATMTFPVLGSASVVSTPSVCGSTTGAASVIFTAGASANYTLEWSTGETGATISNLAPGPYYFSTTDDYNCHLTGVTSVGATGITITPTITNVSCNGLNNGSIGINIVNPNSYQFLWSNGYGTQTISNLAPGNYSVNVWDNNGCQVSGSYTITEPAPITASLLGNEPTCGAANGGVSAFVTATGTPIYDWIGTGQAIQNLSGVGHGLYTLKVTDGSGCIKQFTYQLDDEFAVDIETTVLNTQCNQNNGGITVNFTQDPNGGTLATSWSWSNGTTTQSNFNLAAGPYTITALSGPMAQPCYSEKTVIVGTRAPLSQPICLVTVDTATTTNLVVWERTETSGIHHYNIYRESDLAGNYQLIDTVMNGSLSFFNDVVASPMDRSWRYKMSAVNDCGAESPISTEHKTLHLNTILNVGNGSFDILWDDYEGSGNVTGYVVWRKTDQVDWMPASLTIALGTSFYNDVPPLGSTGVDYYIEMELNSLCTAEKAQDFNTTRSNRERGQFAAGDGVDGASSNSLSENYLNEILMYPNPTQGAVTFVQSGNETITFRVTSLSGNVVSTTTSSESKTAIQLDEFQSGVYLVEISYANYKITKRIGKY